MNFSNIILQHKQSILKSRSEADIRVSCNNLTLNAPVCLSNMPSCQNERVLNIFNIYKLPYVYHRLNGASDILNFTTKINNEKWYLKSISVGVSLEDRDILTKIKQLGLQLDWITIDVALIYNIHFEEHIKWVRKQFPDVYLIAGNFSTPECSDWLYNMGVDCGKFGIGVSELCRTRQYTGFGSTLDDFIKTANTSKIDLMFDGGLTILDEERGEIAYGDIYKAINLGAKWVMSSSLFRWSHELSDHGIVNQYGNSTARAKGYNKNVEGAVKNFKSQYYIEEQLRIIKENLQSSISYAGKKSLS
jgi:GMP reductase